MSLTKNTFNAVMKHARRYVRKKTVRNDLLLVHEHWHRVYFATGKLRCINYTLLEAIPRAPQPLLQICHVLYWRLVLVPASLPKCDNQPDCWVAICQEQWIRELSDEEAASLFDVNHIGARCRHIHKNHIKSDDKSSPPHDRPAKFDHFKSNVVTSPLD